MVDPRLSMIDKRLKGTRRIIAVSSGKGGVGKSLVATILALTLARKGIRVGLFDVDFTSPSSHIILGTSNLKSKEDKGIIPPEIHSIKYMSIFYYTGERASPLRGIDISNALLELLAVTIWDNLDYLIIDMPPGISDTILDILRFIKNVEFLIVTTPSQLTFETVKKFIGFLSELKVPVIGIIENMKRKESKLFQQQVERKGVKYWGSIYFESDLEESIGKVDKLLKTRFSKKIKAMVEENLNYS